MITIACLTAGIVSAHGLDASYFMAEGEALVAELADDVLANKQEMLPVPFEILKDRDVGYVGNHPLLPSAWTEFKRGTFNASDVAIYSVRIAESMQPAVPPPSFRLGGPGGKSFKHLNGVKNPSAELVVHQWQKSRWWATEHALKYWIDLHKMPNKLVVLHSNGDVLYGGCTDSELKSKYKQVIDANGGGQTVVVAAEVSPFPKDLGWVYSQTDFTAARMSGAVANMQVPAAWASQYADCSNATEGLCNSPPKYQFANSGVIMGPAGDLLDMLKGLVSYTGEENRLVSEYFLNHPDKVALDYTGVLALSLHNLAKVLPVEVATVDEKRILKSKVTKKPVCFVHGAGNSFGKLQDLARELTQ